VKKNKLSELFIIAFSTIVTVLVATGAIRYFAPQLLGLSSDIQLVKTSKRVPPFFDGVFRVSDYKSEEYIIPDPYVKRAKPLFPDLGGMGPNDLLGFRNRSIPNVADIVIIGDSQTYGNNASLETNWPNLFMSNLRAANNKNINHYDMAVGGWGAIEYLEIFYKSLAFQPKMLVVAFYTGNDPLETFRLAYSNNRWKTYQTDKSLSIDDMPHVEFPPPKEDLWGVTFNDKVETVFTPKNRLHSNEKSSVVQAGYDAMLIVAKEIAKVCEENNISPVFTIIPTKELVYFEKIKNEITDIPKDYSTLVGNELEYIRWLSTELARIKGTQFINLVKVLQKAALKPVSLYPDDGNGHPIATGYKIIADQLAKEIKIERLITEGLVALFTTDSSYQLGLIRDGSYGVFSSTDLIEANGWDPDTIPVSIKSRDIANLNRYGLITTIDPQKYGPR
jgi:hypothetical protein